MTLYATKAPKVLDRIGIGSVMVGAANSDSARISFLGGTEGGLARELDRGSRCSLGLLKCPPNRARWSPITRLTNSALGLGTYYSAATGATIMIGRGGRLLDFRMDGGILYRVEPHKSNGTEGIMDGR